VWHNHGTGERGTAIDVGAKRIQYMLIESAKDLQHHPFGTK